MKINVLIVDDEDLERVLLKKGFAWEEKGFEVIGEAAAAKDALEFVARRKPDIILTDINMPQMDGLELSEQVKIISPSSYIIIITGYREFEYAKKAIRIGVEDFLLKPIDMQELEKIVIGIREKIIKQKEHNKELENLKSSVLADKDIVMESFLQRLVEDRIEEQEATTRLMAYNIQHILKHCICLNIELREAEQAEKHDRITRILKFIRNQEFEDTVCFVHYMGNIVLFFISEQLETVNEKAVFLQKNIQEMGISNTIGMSEVNRGFHGIADAYRQSGNALDAAALLGRERVIRFKEYQSIIERSTVKKEIVWDDFLMAVTQGLENKVQKYLSEYIHQIEMGKITNREYLILMTMAMLSKVGSTLKKYGESMQLLLGEKAIYEEIQQIRTVVDMQEYLDREIHIIMNFHREKRVKPSNKVIEEAIAYIEKNIFEPDLSLGQVADHIYTNESYLSRVFKQETGTSVIEYITKKRIEESIRLMNSTDLKVYEIAEKIGFRDSHYFSICFKKQTGMTFKEFRKKSNE